MFHAQQYIGDTALMQRLAKPQVPLFEDISKIRNREDKNITFLTDVDTSLRDFYWYYDGNEALYDSTLYPVPVNNPFENLDDAAKMKLAINIFTSLLLAIKEVW